MFDFRQERLDEIVEAEAAFQDHSVPADEDKPPIVQPGFLFSIAVAIIGAATS